ncbi:MAG: hypothetical protein M3R53_08065 [Candidatus Eremiobacteraeota bacterium]|nr:hypothetical protein [Candidatus Eremiobacteraeota bacterium]
MAAFERNDQSDLTAGPSVWRYLASATRAVRAARAARPVRSAAILAAMLLAGALAGPRALADDAPARDIVHNVVVRNAEIQSYEAQVAVDFHLRNFPYLSEHLDGTTYFKRPDNFEVVFTGVPSYAKGFQRIYSDIGDPVNWDRRFDMSLESERDVRGHRDLVVRLVQKVRGMIDHEDVAIDPATWHIDSMEWHYYNGGVIAMSQEYQNVGRFAVLAKQDATIRIPFVHGSAQATYRDYRTNVAIDDSVFTHDKH